MTSSHEASEEILVQTGRERRFARKCVCGGGGEGVKKRSLILMYEVDEYVGGWPKCFVSFRQIIRKTYCMILFNTIFFV